MAATWHSAHFNAIANDIRDSFPMDWVGISWGEKVRNMHGRASLTLLALKLAERFQEANDTFDPLKFLDACSPNVELYPLSELWEGDDNEDAT